MAASEACLLKPSLVSGLPHSKPVPFVRSCSRKSKLVKMQSNGSQRSMIRVFDQDSLLKNSSTAVKIFQNDAFVKAPSELLMSQQFESNLNLLSKWIATAMFIFVLVWKYDGECLWLAMGGVINYIICLTLKRVLKQDRPVLSLKSDPGMPSSHAQSIFYIFTTILLSMIEIQGGNALTLTISALGFACASYLSWLRVSQQFHTRSQVIVGGAVGSLFSIIWHWSWHSYVMHAFVLFWWVRASILLGAATFFLGYLLYIIRHALHN